MFPKCLFPLPQYFLHLPPTLHHNIQIIHIHHPPKNTPHVYLPAYQLIPMINMSGMRELPCLKLIFTLNSSGIREPTKTLPFVPLYIPSTYLTSDSGTPIHIDVTITISLGPSL